MSTSSFQVQATDCTKETLLVGFEHVGWLYEFVLPASEIAKPGDTIEKIQTRIKRRCRRYCRCLDQLSISLRRATGQCEWFSYGNATVSYRMRSVGEMCMVCIYTWRGKPYTHIIEYANDWTAVLNLVGERGLTRKGKQVIEFSIRRDIENRLRAERLLLKPIQDFLKDTPVREEVSVTDAVPYPNCPDRGENA